MKLLLLHGPNLNLLGRRPGDVPGLTEAAVEGAVREEAARLGAAEVRFLQSNHEGALLDALQQAREWATGVVLNPGVLGHTGWALREAVAAVGLPVVEVQLDVPATGEPWRQVAVLDGVAAARVCGRGLQGYVEAVRWMADGARGTGAGGAGAEVMSASASVAPARSRRASFPAMAAGSAGAGRQVGAARPPAAAAGSPAEFQPAGGGVSATEASDAIGGASVGLGGTLAFAAGSPADSRHPGVGASAADASSAGAEYPVAAARASPGADIPGAGGTVPAAGISGAPPSGGDAGRAPVERPADAAPSLPGARKTLGPAQEPEAPAPAEAGGLPVAPAPEPARAGVMQPVRPSTTARDCAFCADEPCELHAGMPPPGARSGVGLGLAGEAMLRLRALKVDGLLAETDASIAALQGKATAAEVRFEHALEARPAAGEGTAKAPQTPAAAQSDMPSQSTPGAQDGGRGPAAPVRKSIGPAAPPLAPAAARKTLGRARPEASTPPVRPPGASLRTQLADTLAAHLAGAVSAKELAAFAREGWMALAAGADFPAAEHERLEPVLRQLMFLDRKGSTLDAPSLVSLLASLQ